MTPLRIAMLQIEPVMRAIEQNMRIGEKFCREAAAKEADIALFPEMFSNGYPCEGDRFGAWRKVAFDGGEPDAEAIARETSYAIDDDHPYVENFRGLARELGMAMAVTYMGKGIKSPRNVVLIIDRHGKDLIKYAKIHLFEPFLIDALCEPGENYFVKELDTKVGPVKLGAMICSDRDFPESGRILMKYGAEIVLIPNACPLEKAHGAIITDKVKVRAVENAMAIVICNYPSSTQEGHRAPDGHSAAFGPDGKFIVRAGEEEGVFIAEYDLDAIRQYRNQTYCGDAFRKERYYGPLLDAPVPEVFAGRKNCVGVIRR